MNEVKGKKKRRKKGLNVDDKRVELCWLYLLQEDFKTFMLKQLLVFVLLLFSYSFFATKDDELVLLKIFSPVENLSFIIFSSLTGTTEN